MLVEALPFILKYDNKTIVVKYGGHAMDGGVPREFAQDVVLMKQTGINPVVVHGGGPQIGAMLKRLNIASSFVDGLRVTDAAAMEVVEMVLSGTINKQIVAGINSAGGRAVGVSGKDGNMLIARRIERSRTDPVTRERIPVDLGFVGEPDKVDAEVLRMIIEFGTDSGRGADWHRAEQRNLQHQCRHRGGRRRGRDSGRTAGPADRCGRCA